MNKVKILFLTIIVCILSLYFVSCTTTFSKNNGDENILIIPLNNEKQEGVIAFGTYALTINEKVSGDVVQKVRINSGDEYAIVTNLTEGDYFIGSHFFIFTPSEEISSEENESYPSSFCSFSLTNGMLTVSPVCFGTLMTQEAGFRGKKRMELKIFDDPEKVYKQKVLEKLNSDYPKLFLTWKISE